MQFCPCPYKKDHVLSRKRVWILLILKKRNGWKEIKFKLDVVQKLVKILFMYIFSLHLQLNKWVHELGPKLVTLCMNPSARVPSLEHIAQEKIPAKLQSNIQLQ